MLLFEFVGSSSVRMVKTAKASSCEHGSNGRRNTPAQARRRSGTAGGRGSQPSCVPALSSREEKLGKIKLWLYGVADNY